MHVADVRKCIVPPSEIFSKDVRERKLRFTRKDLGFISKPRVFRIKIQRKSYAAQWQRCKIHEVQRARVGGMHAIHWAVFLCPTLFRDTPWNEYHTGARIIIDAARYLLDQCGNCTRGSYVLEIKFQGGPRHPECFLLIYIYAEYT